MPSKPLFPFTVDDFLETTGLGSIRKALGMNLRGIDYMKTGGAVPPNKTNYGYVFFVRPQLNLQTDNVRLHRKLYSLLNNQPESIHRYVRAILDPRIMYPYSYTNNRYSSEGLKCPFVDPQMPFIPVMSNNLKSITGWPDSQLPIFTSKPGIYKEVYAQPDGQIRNYGSFNVTANFKNTMGSPIIYMTYIWELYMSLVHEGILLPYPDMIMENERDYDTRIYRITTDQTKKFVKEISSTGISFPTSTATSSLFDYNSDKPHNDTNSEFGITFESLGMDFFDDINILEFNKTVECFHNGFKNGKVDSGKVKEVDPTLGVLFNYRVYPYIDTSGAVNRLRWYTNKEYYESRMTYFSPILGYNAMFRPNDIVSYDVKQVLDAMEG